MTSFGPSSGSSRSPSSPDSSSSGSLGLDTLFDNLKSAGIVTLFEPPSPEIQSQLDIIWAHQQSDERREQVIKIANKLSRKFSRLGSGQRDDDWIESIVHSLEELDSNEFFTVTRKAELSVKLRPLLPSPPQLPQLTQQVQPPQQFLKTNTGPRSQSNRPHKRQRRNVSSLQSQSIKPQPLLRRSARLNSSPTPPSLPPPPPQSAKPSSSQKAIIQTPVPYVMFGFHRDTICRALVQRGLDEEIAKEYLDDLNGQRKFCFTPTRTEDITLRYPFLVVEGNGYSTEKPMASVHYQTSRSGSYLVNHQQQLIKAFGNDCFIPGENGKTPLVFSMSAEGDILDLWVHYFQYRYKMNRIQARAGYELADLFLKLDRIMGWYKDNILNEVADALFLDFSCPGEE